MSEKTPSPTETLERIRGLLGTPVDDPDYFVNRVLALRVANESQAQEVLAYMIGHLQALGASTWVYSHDLVTESELEAMDDAELERQIARCDEVVKAHDEEGERYEPLPRASYDLLEMLGNEQNRRFQKKLEEAYEADNVIDTGAGGHAAPGAAEGLLLTTAEAQLDPYPALELDEDYIADIVRRNQPPPREMARQMGGALGGLLYDIFGDRETRRRRARRGGPPSARSGLLGSIFSGRRSGDKDGEGDASD